MQKQFLNSRRCIRLAAALFLAALLVLPAGRALGASRKKILFIGDSITWGYISSGKRAEETIPEIVKKELGVSVKNAGKNGACLAYAGKKSKCVVGRLELNSLHFERYDVIVIAAGTNDHRHAVPLGTRKDQDRRTFYGAWNRIFTCLEMVNPEAKVVIVTPIYKTLNLDMTGGSGYGLKNKKGISLLDYVKAERVIARKYGAWLYDSSKKMIINEENADKMLGDGLHPNQAGYRKLGEAFADWLGNKLKIRG